MKATEIRELTDDELLARETELVHSVFNLKIQFATGQLNNTAGLKKARRDLARVKTILKERNLKGKAPAKVEPKPARPKKVEKKTEKKTEKKAEKKGSQEKVKNSAPRRG